MAVEFLRNDSQARKAFIEKIAAPVLNKMFECGYPVSGGVQIAPGGG